MISRNATSDCDVVMDSFRSYLEGDLGDNEAAAIEQHLLQCKFCKKEFQTQKKVLSLLGQAYKEKKISDDFDHNADRRLLELKRNPSALPVADGASAKASGRHAFMVDETELDENAQPAGRAAALFNTLGAAPWWGVSVMLHALVIALAGLISMAVSLPPSEDAVIMVTELAPRPQIKEVEQEKKANDNRSALETKHDTPPTDPTSKENSDIVVPPDILAKAILGDHFETVNPDRPDTQSAFGNPDAHMFHSVQGNDEPEGGGGSEGSSLEDMIGVGGAGSPGSGGGWGGGHGTGTGVGNGSGRGSFGSRNGGGRVLMVKRHGGSKASENAVDKALEWLARHQEQDGHWDCQKYEGGAGDDRCKNISGDAAVTGFALLAFLGAGHTEKIGKYRDNVDRGLKWMIKTLNEEEKKAGPGRFTSVGGSNYCQGVSALALAEASGMSPRYKELKEAAQKAIDGVVAGQVKIGDSEYVAWGYNPRGVLNDTSVTGWNVMAIKSAKIAGLHVDPFSFEGAMRWINAGQDLKGAPKGAGEAEYWEGGMMIYRATLANPVSRTNMAMTAAAALTRLMVGGERPDVPGVSGPCNLMKKPENLPNKWPGNLYYWYYGTLVMFQKGGDHWKAWNEPMKPTLINAQRKDGDFDGSWDPLDGENLGYVRGGRVMSTALGALCLEVYYRYAKLAN